MSTVILTKTVDCTDIISVVHPVTTPTQFTLTTSSNIVATITFNGTNIGKLTSSNPQFNVYVAGDYTITLVGMCHNATVCVDDILDEGAASNQIDSDLLINCAGDAETVAVGQVISIAGSERPLNVRVIEDCVQQDFEIVCADTDGRILLLQTIANPPELTEIDGSAIGDGAVAANCDVEYVTSESCFQDDTDNSIRYTRLVYIDVDDPTNITIIWLDSAGAVIATPSNIEPCSSLSGTLDDQTHVLSHGVDINVPTGAKSVAITRLTGTVTVDGTFQLGDPPLPASIAYEAVTADGSRGLLPAIVLAGGTWQWSAILPTAEI